MSLSCRALARNAAPVIAKVLVAGLALGIAACAKEERHQQDAYRMHGPMASAERQAPVEIEEDGLPVQTPPPRGQRHEPDDPSEPYSPNYGARTPQRRADAMPAPSDRPSGLPRRQQVADVAR